MPPSTVQNSNVGSWVSALCPIHCVMLAVLQDLAQLGRKDMQLIKDLMHGSSNPQQAYPSAPWLFDIVSITCALQQSAGLHVDG